jgi:hypothetical protein
MAEWGRSGTGDRRVGDSHVATFQRAGGRGLRRIVRRRPPTLTIPDSEVVVPRFGGVALLGADQHDAARSAACPEISLWTLKTRIQGDCDCMIYRPARTDTEHASCRQSSLILPICRRVRRASGSRIVENCRGGHDLQLGLMSWGDHSTFQLGPTRGVTGFLVPYGDRQVACRSESSTSQGGD